MNSFDFKELDSADLIVFSLKLLAGAALFWGLSHHFSSRLPAPANLMTETAQDPIQTDLSSPAPFQESSRSHSYSIQPKADYKIWGVVVEKHDTSSWLNITHSQVGDFFNTHDLCIIWGENASSPHLKNLRFSHGDWTCYVQTKDPEAWKKFRKDQLSNNHILPANDEILDFVRSVQIGDQVELSGQLVDYSTDGNPPRKTSLIRTDTENGACEVIYVKEARFLARPPLLWRLSEKFSILLMWAAGLLIAFALLGLPYIKRGTTHL